MGLAYGLGRGCCYIYEGRRCGWTNQVRYHDAIAIAVFGWLRWLHINGLQSYIRLMNEGKTDTQLDYMYVSFYWPSVSLVILIIFSGLYM